MSAANFLLEHGLLPDPILRAGIRGRLERKLREERRGGPEAAALRKAAFADWMRSLPAIAEHTREANQQHYEVPTEFFRLFLGPRMKYSSALWQPGIRTLGEAEDAMLDLYVQRAGVADGMRILDLGCGWGSLSLYLAERFPGSRILGVSNSATQRAHICDQASRRGLGNLEVRTCNVNDLELPPEFDRVMSVEMFEHLRNWERLLERVAGFLVPGGELFVHIFTHREWAYPYDAEDPEDWIGRHFFTGGILPSDDLFGRFSRDFEVARKWWVNGTHYGRTAEAWLSRLDASRPLAWPILEQTYGPGESRTWWNRWRVFLLACAEMWNYAGGEEWGVSHYRLVPQKNRARAGGPKAPKLPNTTPNRS